MVLTSRSKFGIKVYDVWYAEKSLSKSGIITYRESIVPIGKNITEFGTLVSDLRVSEEEVVAKLSKNCRYEARRAAREGVTIEIYESPGESIIEDFCEFYAEFWESKDYGQVDVEKLHLELCGYAQKQALTISKAVIKNKTIVYHTYILDKQYTRLLHSASLFRTDDEIPQNLVGMANRYLHKEEMLFFKHKGIAFYDWGGAGESEEVLSITEFKKSFGGEPKTFYNGEEIKGLLPKLAHWYLSRRNKT